MLIVRRHIHGQQSPVDLTDYTTALDIALSTREPWTSITTSLRLPFAARDLAPDPGDHITIHNDASPRAIAWGHTADAPSPGLIREGTKLHGGTTRTRAVSWLRMLAEAQVYAHASPSRTTTVGTLFNLEDWSRRAAEVLGVVNGRHGEQLTKLLRLLARLRLPESLGGGLLGDSIAVAHDSETSARLGLHSRIDRVMGPRLASDQVWPGATNALSMLVSLFQPDRNFVELYETLCPVGGNLGQIMGETMDIERARLESQDRLGRAGFTAESSELNEERAEVDYLRSSRAIVGDGALVGRLKAIPTLVYRIFPGRVASLASYLKTSPGMSVYDRAIEMARTLFPEAITWPGPEFTFESHEVVDFPNPMRTNAERVNAVAVDPGIASEVVKFWEQAGLPILDEPDIARFGLRMLDIRWPYFAPEDADWVAWLQLVSGLAAQLFLRRERFYTGTFRARLRLDMQQGRAFEIRMPNGRRFAGYAETVRHNVTREGTVLAGWTTVSYSRGHYDDQNALPAFTPPPPPPAPKPMRKADRWHDAGALPRTQERIDMAMRTYAFFSANGMTPAWSLACVHQCGFESAWNPKAINYVDKIERTRPAAIGLFQINVFGGLGDPKPTVFDGKKAGTNAQSLAEPAVYWDAENPLLNCTRVLLATFAISHVLDVAVDQGETTYASYFKLLNSPVGGGFQVAQSERRQHRYAEGRRLFGSVWEDASFSRRTTKVPSIVDPFASHVDVGSLGIPAEVRALIERRVTG